METLIQEQKCYCGRKATRICKVSTTDYGSGSVKTYTEERPRCGYHNREHGRYLSTEEIRKI